MGSQDAQDPLISYFDRSVYAVHQYADRLEHEFARPAIIASQYFFNAHPVSSTFIAIFCLLSFAPILFFAGFSVFATLAIIFVATCFAFLAFASVMLVSVSMLILTLLIILLITSFLTVFFVSVFLAGRLAYFLYTNGVSGASQWISEISTHVHSTKSRLASYYSTGSDTSSDSAVLIDSDTKSLNDKREYAGPKQSVKAEE